MKEALKNLVLAVLTVTMLLGIGWIVIRNRSASKPPPQPFPHQVLDVLKSKKPVAIALRGDSAQYPPNTMLAFEKAAALGPDLIMWVDARPAVDGSLIAWSEQDLAISTNGTGWISYMSADEISKVDAGFKTTFDGGKTFPFRGQGLRISTLKEVLNAFPDRLFVINFYDYKEGMRENVAKVLSETKAGERALITSAQDGVLRDLREDHPTWVFGTSRAQVTRLLMLADIFIAEAAPVRGDVFVWDAAADLSRMSERAWDEVQRRQMTSVLVIEKSDLPKWKDRANALVSSDPTWLLRELSPRP